RAGEEPRIVVGDHLGTGTGGDHDRVVGAGEDLDGALRHPAGLVDHAHVHGRLPAAGLTLRDVDLASRRLESRDRGPSDVRRHVVDEARGHELDAHPVQDDIPLPFDPVLIPISGPRMGRRMTQLLFGLIAFGVGIGLMLQSGLGVPPWDVLHQGLSVRFGLTVGEWSVIISVAVLLLWLPLPERFGIGTSVSAVIVGLAIAGAASGGPGAGGRVLAWVVLLGGVLAIGLARGTYIGANLGPGPRDGLMSGIAERGPSVRVSRA